MMRQTDGKQTIDLQLTAALSSVQCLRLVFPFRLRLEQIKNRKRKNFTSQHKRNENKTEN